MEQVYGFDMTDGTGDFFAYTADHLFADIWNRPGLSDRDRRLLLIGLLSGQGAADVLGIQIPAATLRAISTTPPCGRSWCSSVTTPAGPREPGSTPSWRRPSPPRRPPVDRGA